MLVQAFLVFACQIILQTLLDGIVIAAIPSPILMLISDLFLHFRIVYARPSNPLIRSIAYALLIHVVAHSGTIHFLLFDPIVLPDLQADWRFIPDHSHQQHLRREHLFAFIHCVLRALRRRKLLFLSAITVQTVLAGSIYIWHFTMGRCLVQHG